MNKGLETSNRMPRMPMLVANRLQQGAMQAMSIATSNTATQNHNLVMMTR
jgi:hypothetical protein